MPIALRMQLLAALRRDAARADAAPRRRPAALPARDAPLSPSCGAWCCAHPLLRSVLTRLPGRKLVFSNAPVHYSRAVLGVLRVADLFDDVFSIEHTGYRPKPDRQRLPAAVAQAPAAPAALRHGRRQPGKPAGPPSGWACGRSGFGAASRGPAIRRRSDPACCTAAAHAWRVCGFLELKGAFEIMASQTGRTQAPDPADPGQMLEKPSAEKITTAALAAKLDVSEAALYRHFASKAQMFEGLIDFIEETVFGLVNKITAEDTSGLAQIEAVLADAARLRQEESRHDARADRRRAGERERAAAGAHQPAARPPRGHPQAGAALRDRRRRRSRSTSTQRRTPTCCCATSIGRWHQYAKSGFKRDPMEFWAEQWKQLVPA